MKMERCSRIAIIVVLGCLAAACNTAEQNAAIKEAQDAVNAVSGPAILFFFVAAILAGFAGMAAATGSQKRDAAATELRSKQSQLSARKQTIERQEREAARDAELTRQALDRKTVLEARAVAAFDKVRAKDDAHA